MEDHLHYCKKFGYSLDSIKCKRLDERFQRFQTTSKSICQCGQETMSIQDLAISKTYCCNRNIPCVDRGNKIVCETGSLVNVNDKCEEECPSAEGTSAMAIATKESLGPETKKCYLNMDRKYTLNKVYSNSNTNEMEFARMHCGPSDFSIPCFNNFTRGLHKHIRQCYDVAYVGYVQSI